MKERLEVEHLVDTVRLLHVHEKRHSEYGEDEHDQEQEQADVEKRWHRDGQREEQRSNSLGRLDETKNSTDTEYADNSKERWTWHGITHTFLQRLHCKQTFQSTLTNNGS